MQVYVKCPFYIKDNGQNAITCEGLVPGSRLRSWFWHKKDYKIQIEVFCCGRYQNCEIYDALIKKYEEGEEDV